RPRIGGFGATVPGSIPVPISVREPSKTVREQREEAAGLVCPSRSVGTPGEAWRLIVTVSNTAWCVRAWRGGDGGRDGEPITSSRAPRIIPLAPPDWQCRHWGRPTLPSRAPDAKSPDGSASQRATPPSTRPCGTAARPGELDGRQLVTPIRRNLLRYFHSFQHIRPDHGLVAFHIPGGRGPHEKIAHAGFHHI